MLKRIFGLHGTGKSEYVIQHLERCIAEKKHIFYIVPEQQAVSAERNLINKLGNPANMYVEVINFKRLCNRVARECGGITLKTPDSVSGQLIMSHVMYSLKDSLKEYGKMCEDADFALKMLTEVEKMHTLRITPYMFEEVIPEIKKEGSENLANKLSDISLLYNGYSAYSEKNLEYPGDLLDKLYETLLSYEFFKGKVVIIDSFYGFTAQELAIIGEIIKTADDVYVTFLCPDEKCKDMCFKRGTMASHSLRKLAEKSGVKVEDVFLNKNIKHKSTGLKMVAEKFSADAVLNIENGEKSDDGIEIYKCKDIYKEAECALKLVSDLLVSGVKMRQIAICAKNTEDYDGVIDTCFENAGITLFYDKHKDLSSSAIGSLILSAFEIYFSWSLSSFLSYIKTGLSGIDEKDADELEIYMRTWNIGKKDYIHENWYMNPDGITENEVDAEKLERINNSKDLVLSCLDGFCASLDAAVYAKDIANSVYMLITDIDRIRSGKKTDEEKENLDLLYKMLDKVYETLGNELITPRRFYDLFKSTIKNVSTGKIPEIIDRVRFSSVSLMRNDGVEYVIVLGVNDKVFPSAKKMSDIFKTSEIRTLKKLGIEIAEDASEAAYDEIFLAYTALCSAKTKAYVLYSEESTSGEKKQPSVIVSILKNITGTTEKEYKDNFNAVSDETLFESYLTMEDGVEKATVREYFLQKDEYRERIRLSERKDSSLEKLSDENLESLYGNEMRTSYSKIEKYVSCPFSYFCRYTLSLNPETKANLGHLEVGNIVHKALEELVPEFVKMVMEKKPDKSQIKQTVNKKLEEILTKVLPGNGAAKTKRFEYLFGKLSETVYLLCAGFVEELSLSDFVPVDFELDISPGKEIEPAEIRLKDGRTLKIVGKIDRVDLFDDKKTGKKWIRITDYKTGSKELKISDIREGFNLQMLIYLYSIVCKESEKYGKVYPASVIYKIVKTPSESTDFAKIDTDSFNEPESINKVSGFTVNEKEVADAIDKTGSEDSSDKKGNVYITLDEFSSLLEESVQIASEIASEIASGKKMAVSNQKSGKNPCSYCEFISMCPNPGKIDR